MVSTETSTNSFTPSSIAQAVMVKLNSLPLSQQQQVLDFAEFIAKKNNPQNSIWEDIQEIVKQVPEDVWNSIPTDGAEQHDYYIYKIPKKEV